MRAKNRFESVFFSLFHKKVLFVLFLNRIFINVNVSNIITNTRDIVFQKLLMPLTKNGNV